MGQNHPQYLLNLLQTRWNTWFRGEIYHSKWVSFYQQFFEGEDSTSMAVENVVTILHDNFCFQKMKLMLAIIAHSAARICNLITALEETKQPTAPLLNNKLSDFSTWLQRGTVRITFGDSSQDILKEASFKVKQEILETVHNVFEKSILKFSKNFDTHPALPVFKADDTVLNGLTLTNAALHDEWWIYINIARNDTLSDPLDLAAFCKSQSNHVLLLFPIAWK
ncbi:UNVERIFIED_CONTAM: hypothetical protein FKN15_061121 [Acipenser sinensis]